MKTKSLLFVCLFFLPAVSLLAQDDENGRFSLQQAIAYAFRNSPAAANAQLDMESAVHRKKEVAGMGYPQIKASADLKNYVSIPTSLIPGDFVGQPGTFIPVKFGTKYNATAGVDGSQLLFSSDYIFALKASAEFIRLSQLGKRLSDSELAAAITKEYYGVLINSDRLTLLDANITRLEKALGDTRALNEQGFAELIDVERLEVQYNNLRTQKELSLKETALAELRLKYMIGLDLDKPLALTDSLVFNEEEFQELNTGGIDISARPDLQLEMSNQKLLNIDSKRLKWGYLPSLVAYGSFQYNTQRQRTDFFDFDKNDPLKQWYKIGLIGATLQLDIFDGFQRHHQIQQAKIAALKSNNNIRNVQLRGQLEATAAAVTYNNSYGRMLMQKKNMELATHVLEVSQTKYESGVGSNLEVVTAEAGLLEAQANYYIALYDLIVARADYQRATGTILK